MTLAAASPSSSPGPDAAGSPLWVDVVSDFVCPWCYVGLRHLQQALAQGPVPGQQVRLRWLPYFLNPDTPAQGEAYRPFLERKFGSAAAVDGLFARLSGVGRDSAGIAFDFAAIQWRPNTLRAHRLLQRFAALSLDPGALAARLFAAYFESGQDLGDPEVLTALAVACGDEADAVRAFLASTAATAAVQAQVEHIRRLGIDGVPLYVFNGRRVVSGARPAAELRTALEAAAALGALRP